ncbi:MAG: 4Fe-4S binding protein, partial [Firmicutes bacterium]|nr:4Fe-4S binding protein [Bacillota bacterium]
MKYVGHSVTLDKEKCCGCTICLKRCPTDAIRILNGKAVIFGNKCIDCGECIRVCPYHAKKAVVDTLEILKDFEYTIALPAQTLYAQFPGMRDRNIVLTALKKLGFDDVFEVSAACDAISRAVTQDLHYGRLPEHVISSSCPTVVRIIRARFPSLLPNLLDYRSPMELSARWAKKLAMEKTGLPKEKIGCIFISACPAKATSSKHPLGEQESYVDGVLSISEVYPLL